MGSGAELAWLCHDQVMVPFGWRIVVNALAVWLVDALMKTVEVDTGDNGVVGQVLIYLVIGLLLTIVNSLLKPLAHIVAIPLYILTLGLFALVTNALMLLLVSWVSRQMGIGLYVNSFGSAVLAGLWLAILAAIISIPFKRRAPQRYS